MQIKDLIKESHKTAIEKGFWKKCYFEHGPFRCEHCKGTDLEPRNSSELLMLMVTELGEACEALRHGNPPSEHISDFSAVEEELADTVIRIADMCGAYGYRLEEALEAKLKFNKTREYKHGKNF